jgi:hypothetical protein
MTDMNTIGDTRYCSACGTAMKRQVSRAHGDSGSDDGIIKSLWYCPNTACPREVPAYPEYATPVGTFRDFKTALKAIGAGLDEEEPETLTLPADFWQGVESAATEMTTPAKAHDILIGILEDLPIPRSDPPNAAGESGPIHPDFPLYALRNLLRGAAQALKDALDNEAAPSRGMANAGNGKPERST